VRRLIFGFGCPTSCPTKCGATVTSMLLGRRIQRLGAQVVVLRPGELGALIRGLDDGSMFASSRRTCRADTLRRAGIRPRLRRLRPRRNPVPHVMAAGDGPLCAAAVQAPVQALASVPAQGARCAALVRLPVRTEQRVGALHPAAAAFVLLLGERGGVHPALGKTRPMVRRRPERTVLTPCRIGPVDQPRRVAKGPVAGGEDQPVPLEHGGRRSSRLGVGALLDHDELTLASSSRSCGWVR
jgi:hypothetical protein